MLSMRSECFAFCSSDLETLVVVTVIAKLLFYDLYGEAETLRFTYTQIHRQHFLTFFVCVCVCVQNGKMHTKSYVLRNTHIRMYRA